MPDTIEVNITIEYKSDEPQDQTSKRTFPVPIVGGTVAYAQRWLSDHLFLECEKELLAGKYRADLPIADELYGTVSTVELLDPSPQAFAALENTQKVWLELQNSVLEVEHLMSQACAYRDIDVNRTQIEDWAEPHLAKVNAINGAVNRLTKVEDLFLLLLFVNSGTSLVANVDLEQRDWQKQISLKSIKQGLKLRKTELQGEAQSSSISYLDQLTDLEYQELVRIVDAFFDDEAARIIRGYRDKVAHRFQPALDRSELYSQLIFPKQQGKGLVYRMQNTSIEYTTELLYEKMKSALEHYIELLKSLRKCISRFNV